MLEWSDFPFVVAPVIINGLLGFILGFQKGKKKGLESRK